MRGIILFLAAAGLLIWSLLAWAASGLLGMAEGIAAGSAPFIPLPPELIYWVAGLMSGAGGFLVWVVWFVGAAIIVAVTMVLLALTKPRRVRPAWHDPHGTTHDAAVPGPRTYEPGRSGGAEDRTNRPQAGAQPRSAEDIVSRVLGKPTRR